MRVLMMGVVGVCLLAVVSPPANAELVTINIEGVVDTVDDSGNYLEGQINPGDIITGWYTYDTDTPDSNPSETVGHYWHYALPAGISVNISDIEFHSDPSNIEFLVGIGNDGAVGEDGYWLDSYNNEPILDGTSVEAIVWQLEDLGGDALDSDDILGSPPSLEDWQSNHFRIYGERGGYMINGHVTSAIPEPVTVLLFAIGATMMFAKRS